MSSLRKRMTGLNAFLSKVYQKDNMRLSGLLSEVGLREQEIEVLRRDGLEKLVDGCVTFLKRRISQDDDRASDLIAMRMGLDGASPSTLREVGDAFGISRERARQLEQATFDRFRDEKNLKEWEGGVKELAIGLLKKDQSAEDTSDAAEKRHPYFIEEAGSPDGDRHLIIRDNEDKVQAQEIILTSDIFMSFYHDLMDAARRLGWDRLIQSYSVSKIKEQFPRAYERWTMEEDQALKASFSRGADISEQSVLLKRQPGAIRSRLIKLGLVKP